MRKIAFWRTVGASYGFLFTELPRFFILIGGWVVALGVAIAVTVALAFAARLLGMVVGAIAIFCVMFGSIFGFSVAWHRAILVGEPPRFMPRFRGREWRFLGYSLLVALIYFGAMIGGGLLFLGLGFGLAAASGPLGIAAAVLYLVGVVVLWFYFVRLSLVLPAVAVDEETDLLGRAWRRGKGNGTRLLAGTFTCALPVWIVETVFQLMVEPGFGRMERLGSAAATHPSLGVMLIAGPIFVLLYFVQVALTVGFLSFAYRQLTEGEET